MKLTVTGIALALTVALAGVGVVSADDGPNEIQEGETDCLDFIALFELPGVTSPFADAAEVEAGSDFVVETDGDFVGIDFYDAEGVFITWADEPAGTVPDGAATAIICVDTPLDTPLGTLFVPGGSWTYQDGF